MPASHNRSMELWLAGFFIYSPKGMGRVGQHKHHGFSGVGDKLYPKPKRDKSYPQAGQLFSRLII